MKKVIAMTMLSLAAIVGASSAMAAGGNGGGGTNLRYAPFSGDVNHATQREQQSFYYEIAKRQADRKAAAEASKSE